MAKKRKARVLTGVSPTDFITAYQTSTTIAEVVTKTGLTAKQIYSRANKMRREGVPLIRFGKKGVSKHDWKQLAALAKQLSEQK